MPNGKINLYDVMSRLGNIEGKLDQAIKTLDDHHSRLNTVEKIQDTMTGKIGVMSAIFGFVGAIVISIISKFIKN